MNSTTFSPQKEHEAFEKLKTKLATKRIDAIIDGIAEREKVSRVCVQYFIASDYNSGIAQFMRFLLDAYMQVDFSDPEGSEVLLERRLAARSFVDGKSVLVLPEGVKAKLIKDTMREVLGVDGRRKRKARKRK